MPNRHDRREMKPARIQNAVEAQRRIMVKIVKTLACGYGHRPTPVTPEMWKEFWREEARAAKEAGLYSPKTYINDIAHGMESLAAANFTFGA